jgi:cadmium resistance transport/sequestration family protein
MQGLAQTIIAGITAFAATNLDDIVILTLFFAQVTPEFRPKHIVAGQYLGFLALILASLPGYLGGQIVPKTWLGLLGFLPIGIGTAHLIQKGGEDHALKILSSEWAKYHRPKQGFFKRILNHKTSLVAAVTMANGGDNIGIYVPLFANSSLGQLLVILTVFLIMRGVWCILAYLFTQHPLVAKSLTRYGHHLVPFVLIGLGVYILWESETIKLISIPSL